MYIRSIIIAELVSMFLIISFIRCGGKGYVLEIGHIAFDPLLKLLKGQGHDFRIGLKCYVWIDLNSHRVRQQFNIFKTLPLVLF